MNEQQISDLTDLIYDEDPAMVRDFILRTIPEEQARQNFILGEQAVTLFREANEQGKILCAQVILDLLPNTDLQLQFLERVGTVTEYEHDNAHFIFSLALTYGSVELVSQEVAHPRGALLDLILGEDGTNGFGDAVNFNKSEVVGIILQSLESQDDRISLINTAFEEISDNFREDQDAANIVETILNSLDAEHQRNLILSEIGKDAFDSMVTNNHINTASTMLNCLADNEEKQILVSVIDRNRRYESEEMQNLLDPFSQDHFNSDDEYESPASSVYSYNPSDEIESDNEPEVINVLPINHGNVVGNIQDFDAESISEISDLDEEQELNSKKRKPSGTVSPTSSKKYKSEEQDKEGGQGI